MISTRHRVDERVDDARLRAEEYPTRAPWRTPPRPPPARTTREMRSASRCTGARLRCAAATCATMRASSVSAPDALARISSVARPVERRRR
jgi:hypothetical protein